MKKQLNILIRNLSKVILLIQCTYRMFFVFTTWQTIDVIKIVHANVVMNCDY